MEGEAGPSLENAVAKRDTCAVCQGFGEEGHPRGWVSTEDPYNYIYIHYPNVVVLDQSARNGCHVCSYLVHTLKNYDSFELEWDKANELELTREGAFDLDRDTAEAARMVKSLEGDGTSLETPATVIVLKVHLLSNSTKTPGGPRDYTSKGLLEVQFGITGSSSGCGTSDLLNILADPTHPDLPSQDLLSDAHTDLVLSWRKACDDKHEKCRLGLGQSQKLPKRLLEISSDPATGQITKIRLIETTPSSEGIYACLSYCWGQSAQTFKTTKSNFRQYLKSIPFDSLPATIIDTLKLCWKLGFRYVWVDSLCIIQGDEEDWEREASNMASIYGGSNLTLANHLCKDSSESFLQKRRQPEHRFWGEHSAKIVYTDKHTSEERMLYMRRHEDDVRSLDMGRGRDLRRARSPWLDRAWALQEWMLSPRVLHMHRITQWDCFEGHGNEIEHRLLENNPSRRALTSLGTGWGWSWRSIVEEFSRRNISNDEDRLPALAGLAEKYRDATGYEYLAGLWRQELPGALLWSTKRCENYLKSPKGFRAPTWSWASLEGEVELPKLSEFADYTTSVISAGCTYRHPDTLTTVTSAWLDLEGPMSLVTDWTISWIFHICMTDDQDWNVSLDQNTWTAKLFDQSKLYLLRIAVGKKPAYDFALVLEKMEQSDGKDTYRRLGYACTEPDEQVRHEGWEKKVIRLV